MAESGKSRSVRYWRRFHTPASAMSLSEEIIILHKRVKEQEKEIRRLKEKNEFLEEASAFFAASRRKHSQGIKSAKTRY